MHLKPAPKLSLVPDWCPPSLAGMYRDLRRKRIPAGEVKTLIVEHVTRKGVG